MIDMGSRLYMCSENTGSDRLVSQKYVLLVIQNMRMDIISQGQIRLKDMNND